MRGGACSGLREPRRSGQRQRRRPDSLTSTSRLRPVRRAHSWSAVGSGTAQFGHEVSHPARDIARHHTKHRRNIANIAETSHGVEGCHGGRARRVVPTAAVPPGTAVSSSRPATQVSTAGPSAWSPRVPGHSSFAAQRRPSWGQAATSQPVRRHSQRLHELLTQQFARMNRPIQRFGHGHILSSALIHRRSAWRAAPSGCSGGVGGAIQTGRLLSVAGAANAPVGGRSVVEIRWIRAQRWSVSSTLAGAASVHAKQIRYWSFTRGRQTDHGPITGTPRAAAVLARAWSKVARLAAWARAASRTQQSGSFSAVVARSAATR